MANVNPIQVQKFLRGVDYPASRQDLMDYARHEGADENVLQTISRLPSDQFDTPADVSEAIGQMK